MSDFRNGVIGDGMIAATFLAISVGKMRNKAYNAIAYSIAALERASDYLDKISDYSVLVELSVPELENLYSVVSTIQHTAAQLLMYSTAMIDPNDPEAMDKLEKLQKLAIEVIEKASKARAMIMVAIFAKKTGKAGELLDGKLGPLEPSPIVEQEIFEQAMKNEESGDYKDP